MAYLIALCPSDGTNHVFTCEALIDILGKMTRIVIMINDAERYGKTFLGDFYGDLALAEVFEWMQILRNSWYWQETSSL